MLDSKITDRNCYIGKCSKKNYNMLPQYNNSCIPLLFFPELVIIR